MFARLAWKCKQNKLQNGEGQYFYLMILYMNILIIKL